MSKIPDYERAERALAHKAQLDGITIYIAQSVRRNRWHTGDFTFAVDLRINDRPLWSGEYTMGSGHATPSGGAPTPTIADVLHSIFLDASCFEAAGDKTDFMIEFGYATDMHPTGNEDGERAWRGCRKAARDLHDEFTDEQYAEYAQLSSMI